LIARGLVYVPQGNRVFGDLTVQQNLTVSLRGGKKSETYQRLDEMAKLFPAIQEFMHKPAAKLSGGEKQQVALAMGLMKKPRMLLLDEPSLGLAPNLLGDLFKQLHQINRHTGVTILIVEHKVREVFKIADWVLGLRRGEVIEAGKPEAFGEMRLKDLFLG
jgi:branched-chain amino acid transport system ATP-binding protein